MKKPIWLDRIDPAEASYALWLEVGMALHKSGYPVEVWVEWSKRDSTRYHEGECQSKWNGFSADTGGIGPGTAIMNARQTGNYDEGAALDWGYAMSVVDTAFVEAEDIPDFDAPLDTWNPVNELCRFLQAGFHPGDYVGYVLESYDAGTDKKRPTGGYYDRTAEELLSELNRYEDISSVLGALDEEGGAWIVVNPVDGHGRKNANVIDFRHTLIESDDDDLGMQLAIIRELNLPCSTIVYSGARSIHAQVRVDAKDEGEYKERVCVIQNECKRAGLHVDESNKNPSRMMRLPGVMRQGKRQTLIDTNCGAESYNEWIEWLADKRDDLPATQNLGEIWGHLPELKDELIEGILRIGHKCLVVGQSKMGKSFMLMALVIAIAEGATWLGRKCKQGRVLYVNMELDEASCYRRFEDIYTAMDIAPNGVANIDILNLRGKVAPMSELAPQIVHRARKKGQSPEQGGYSLIVIDPLYKVLTGDENNASDMAAFCNCFDLLCSELGCSAVYSHHHSKGQQGFKHSIDRMSGSGVFARDPDAIIDFSPLVTDNEQRSVGLFPEICAIVAMFLESKDLTPPDWANAMPQIEEWAYSQLGDDEADELRGLVECFTASKQLPTAWRGSFTLREFPSPDPLDIWFSYPLHVLDSNGVLADCVIEGEPRRAKSNKEDTEAKIADRKSEIEEAFEFVSMGQGNASISDIADYMGCSSKTVHRRLDEHGGFTRKGGVAWRS